MNLRWNMVNYPVSTAYTLFESADGLIWTVAAANPVFRNYTASTILAYTDEFSDENKLYYRVKVYDRNENIVEISNTAIVNNPVSGYHSSIKKQPVHAKDYAEEKPVSSGVNTWQIFPNPVGSSLNLVHSGNGIITGVINIAIQDASGKAVIRFRAASTSKQVSIDVSQLHSGIYFIRLNVLNDLQMNEKFVKR